VPASLRVRCARDAGPGVRKRMRNLSQVVQTARRYERSRQSARWMPSAATVRMQGLLGGGSALPGNNVQRYREALMMSKAELARKAGLSTLTIDRVEAGRPCRLDTKRKVLLALGLRISDKDRVFGLRNDAPISSALLAAAETRS
jgi:DNA-binding XRE family transcriptional regulator